MISKWKELWRNTYKNLKKNWYWLIVDTYYEVEVEVEMPGKDNSALIRCKKKLNRVNFWQGESIIFQTWPVSLASESTLCTRFLIRTSNFGWGVEVLTFYTFSACNCSYLCSSKRLQNSNTIKWPSIKVVIDSLNFLFDKEFRRSMFLKPYSYRPTFELQW